MYLPISLRGTDMKMKMWMVVGDDVNSEIKAAQELGVEAVWYDKYSRYEPKEGVKKISDYRKLVERLLVF